MREACELREPTEDYSASPLQENLFEWHFTVKGANGTEFEGGVYHGRIIFPNEYPMKPPNIILLTVSCFLYLRQIPKYCLTSVIKIVLINFQYSI